MKLIHCADIHLGSKMEARLPGEKAEERKKEVRATFQRMVQYAAQEGVTAILLAGDVFDSDRPFKRDKEFFYSVVRNNPEIDFLYLRGNHDSLESYTEDDLENLKTFGKEWTTYTYGNVTITGIELAPENAASIYSTLELDPDQQNFVMLHGQADSSRGKDRIHIARLGGKQIDYLALGHIHSYSVNKLDDRGVYVYSGCLEGRGFDETGEKGFVLIETDGQIRHRFIPFACRTIEEVTVDISDTEDSYHAAQRVRAELSAAPDHMLRINLTGEIAFDNDLLEKELEAYLAPEYYFVSVKDKTTRKIDPDSLAGDVSLRGEFIRTVLQNESYSETDRQQIIRVGLRALRGESVEG